MKNKLEEPKIYNLAQKLRNIPSLISIFLISPSFKTILDFIRICLKRNKT